jgi:hypothetical protein
LPAWAKSETLSQKYPTQKRPGREDQLAEHLPTENKALNLKPQYTQKKISPHIKYG